MSINHLDEQACVNLHKDEHARQIYRGHLRRLAELAAPGAVLIVTDADRRNLYAWIGIRNPLAPAIEWEKNQSPKLWARLLADVGFEAPDRAMGRLEHAALARSGAAGQPAGLLPADELVPRDEAALQRFGDLKAWAPGADS